MATDHVLHRISDLYDQLDRGKPDAIPKYQKVCELIRSLVDQQELKPGDRLPRESDMAATLSVSLGTVRNALNTLSSEGYLSREQGRGTFVTERGSRLVDLWHFRFIDTNGDKIVPVYTTAATVFETEYAESSWLGGNRAPLAYPRHRAHELGVVEGLGMPAAALEHLDVGGTQTLVGGEPPLALTTDPAPANAVVGGSRVHDPRTAAAVWAIH